MRLDDSDIPVIVTNWMKTSEQISLHCWWLAGEVLSNTHDVISRLDGAV